MTPVSTVSKTYLPMARCLVAAGMQSGKLQTVRC
jgi:hypothetical protein